MVSVGSILGGAFGLLRERPGTVVIWAVTYCLGSLVISLAMSLAMFGALMPSEAYVAPDQIWAGPVFSLVLFLNLCLLLLAVVLMNAVFRAVLRPQDGGFAFMRLGMDEFRMLGLVVLFCVLGYAATLIGMLILLLVSAVLGFTLGSSAVAGLVSLVLALAFLGALVWAEVRLSLIFPLTFLRRRITVDGAWELTRGRFWLLFTCYLLIGLIFAIVIGSLMWMAMGDYFAALAQANGDQEQMRLAAEALVAKQLGMPLATKILLGVAGAILFAAGLALGPGLLASATRELLGDPSEAAVFAAESDGSVVD